MLLMRVLGGYRLQHVLRLSCRSVTVSGTTEELESMKMHLKWPSVVEGSD